MAIESVKIVGLGLVGGSLAKLWREVGIEVLGWDADDQTRQLATEAGVQVPVDYSTWLQVPADLVLVATPISIIEGIFGDLARHVRPDQVVADVGSVKEWPARWARESGIFDSYVGLHPMAGLAASGFSSSDSSIYRDVPWVLVPGGAPESITCEMGAFLIDTTNARLLVTDTKSHDDAAALVSHLPHVIANSLLLEVAKASCGPLALAMSAGSFKDLTRVAGIDPSRTANMLRWNRPPVIAAINLLVGQLTDVSGNLRNENSSLDFLDRAQEVRRSLQSDSAVWDAWIADGDVCQELAQLTDSGRVVTAMDREQGGWRISGA